MFYRVLFSFLPLTPSPPFYLPSLSLLPSLTLSSPFLHPFFSLPFPSLPPSLQVIPSPSPCFFRSLLSPNTLTPPPLLLSCPLFSHPLLPPHFSSSLISSPHSPLGHIPYHTPSYPLTPPPSFLLIPHSSSPSPPLIPPSSPSPPSPCRRKLDVRHGVKTRRFPSAVSSPSPRAVTVTFVCVCV